MDIVLLFNILIMHPYHLLFMAIKHMSVELNGLSEIISVDHLKPLHIPSSDDFVDSRDNIVS